MMPPVMTATQTIIADLWNAGTLLADICITLGMSAPSVMDEVRGLRLPERHLTTGEIVPGSVVDDDAGGADALGDSASRSRPPSAD